MFRIFRLGPSSNLRRLQALPEAPSTIVLEGGTFDDVAWEALYATEEVIYEGDFSAMSNPPVASIEYPSLVVEDFLEEEQVSLTPSESNVQSKPTPPAPAPTQTMHESGRSILILRNGKI